MDEQQKKQLKKFSSSLKDDGILEASISTIQDRRGFFFVILAHKVFLFMHKFLIIQTAFLGDVVLATPVISELKKIYPDCEVHVVVRKGNDALLSNHRDIDRLFVWNKSNGKYRSLLQIRKEIRQFKYREVINLQRYFSAGFICWSAKSDHKIGFTKNVLSFMYSSRIEHDMTRGVHEVSRNLKTIQHHGAQTMVRPSLYPSPQDYDSIATYTSGEYYCLAPASVWFTKQLPQEKWTELINQLSNNATIYLIGGPTDIALCEAIKVKTKHPRVEILAGKMSLLQSAALMQKATMNFVNDSGPQHLASAMNAPVRSFFCSTVTKFGFGPLSDDSRVIETNENLPCRPCGLHGKKECPQGHFKCGLTIDVSTALK